MHASNWLEEAILTYFFTTNTAPTRPTVWYMGYGTAAADTGVTEPVGNGYARTAAALTLTESPAGTWKISNTSQIEFPAASGGNHGTITHLGLWTASTAGTHLVWIPLTASQVINDGNILRVAAGAATVEAQ
jgi:hypothetical protein